MVHRAQLSIEHFVSHFRPIHSSTQPPIHVPFMWQTLGSKQYLLQFSVQFGPKVPKMQSKHWPFTLLHDLFPPHMFEHVCSHCAPNFPLTQEKHGSVLLQVAQLPLQGVLQSVPINPSLHPSVQFPVSLSHLSYKQLVGHETLQLTPYQPFSHSVHPTNESQFKQFWHVKLQFLP